MVVAAVGGRVGETVTPTDTTPRLFVSSRFVSLRLPSSPRTPQHLTSSNFGSPRLRRVASRRRVTQSARAMGAWRGGLGIGGRKGRRRRGGGGGGGVVGGGRGGGGGKHTQPTKQPTTLPVSSQLPFYAATVASAA
ncbi:hypothetical protein M0804_014731 [Polistes exclamans]|nr:hypothetical protein M0804_014732 [Polistes exclamans]KAI4474669.1 hypothetical protein M0804_014731 [Polistes exclamans]